MNEGSGSCLSIVCHDALIVPYINMVRADGVGAEYGCAE